MSQHSHGRVVRNIIGLLVTQLGTWAVTLVLTLVLPRYMGVELYGVYAFSVSFTSIISICMNLGMGTYLTWRIAQHPEEAGKLTLNALLIQIPLGLLFSLIAILIVPLLDPSALVIHLVVISAASTVLGGCVATCVAGLAGLQHIRIPSFIGLICSAIGTSAILVAIQMHGNIVVLAVCGFGAQALNLIVMLVYAQTKLHLTAPIEIRLWPKLLAGGMPFFAWSAVLLFYGQVDITLTKILAGDVVVGWYAAANRIVSIPVFLPTIVVTAVLPALARERVPSSPRFRELASHSMRVVMLVGIPAAIGTVLLATHLVSLLRFPASFDQVSPLIVILGINMPLIGVDMVLGTVLIAIGRQKAWTGVGIISAVFNPLANLWAIPYTQHMYGNGAIGAAAVSVATEFIMLLGALVLLPRPLFGWSDLGYIVRCLLAAALMVPAVRALAGYGATSVALAVLYGASVYAMAAYLLHLVTDGDVRGLTQTVLARLGTDGSRLSRQAMADNARRVLANVQNAAQSAAGRLQTISRPLASGAAYVMGSVSQPFTAARQTALRVGGSISRPLGAARNTMAPSTDGSSGPTVVRADMTANADSSARGAALWGIPLVSTAPLPSLAEVQSQYGSEVVAIDGGNGDDVWDDEEGRWAALPEHSAAMPVEHNGRHREYTPERPAANGRDPRQNGSSSRPRQPKRAVPTPAPARSRDGSDLPGGGRAHPMHPDPES